MEKITLPLEAAQGFGNIAAGISTFILMSGTELYLNPGLMIMLPGIGFALTINTFLIRSGKPSPTEEFQPETMPLNLDMKR